MSAAAARPVPCGRGPAGLERVRARSRRRRRGRARRGAARAAPRGPARRRGRCWRAPRGKLLFGALGFVLAIPMLRRLHRRTRLLGACPAACWR